jgi:sugar phosphate permease
LGGACVPWISHALIARYGWQAALRYLGVAIVVASLPLALMVKERPLALPMNERPLALPVNERAQPVPSRSVAQNGGSAGAFKSPAFYLLMFGSMCSIAAVSGTQQNLKLFLSLDRHFSQSAAAQVISLVLAASIFGRLLIGWLADRFPKKYVMMLTYFFVAAGIPTLFLGQQTTALYISSVIFGIGLGGDYMIVPLIAAELFERRILGRLLGVVLTAGGVAEALSPWMVGYLRDRTGTYFASCIALVLIAMVGMVAVAGLPKVRKA